MGLLTGKSGEKSRMEEKSLETPQCVLLEISLLAKKHFNRNQ